MRKPFENIVKKGENAGNQHFLLFPQCFLPYQGHESSAEIRCTLKLSSDSASAFNLDHRKILPLTRYRVTSLSNNKSLDWTILKAFADNK